VEKMAEQIRYFPRASISTSPLSPRSPDDTLGV